MLAVVMGRNYTSRLGMIRAAGMAGCRVCDINTDRRALEREEKIDKVSKYVESAYPAPEPDSDALIRVLKDHCRDSKEKTILLPTDDYTAAVIDLRQEELKEDFLYPNASGGAGEVVRLMDKDHQKELAAAAGLETAKGWSVSIGGGGYEIPEDIVFPCFVKPQTSFEGSKFYMKKCENRLELDRHLKSLSEDLAGKNKEAELLIEQYITIEKEYDIPGFTDGKMTFLPVFIQKGVIHLGVTGTGTLLDAGKFADTREKLVRFIGGLGFTGLIDIEMFESGGKIWFNELNLRFGATGFAMTGAGINMPKMLIETLTLGGPKTIPDAEKAFGWTFTSEKVLYQEFRDDKITWKEFCGNLDRSDILFIKNQDDPAPYAEFEAFMKKFRLKKKIKGFLHRK